MEREVGESVDHAHVAADHTRTAAGRDGDGSPSGVVGGVVGHRAPHFRGVGECPLEKNGVCAQGDVFRAFDGCVASSSPDGVVAIHHGGCWGALCDWFSIVQRFFLARPGVHEVKITNLRHQHHEDGKDEGSSYFGKASAGHNCGVKATVNIASSYYDRFHRVLTSMVVDKSVDDG